MVAVLKVVAEGDVTSFRYPHFIQGVQPTYPVPPPATIYGHVCSAWGDLLPPDALWFAYHFRSEARFTDYEHLHFVTAKGYDKMNPFQRDLLFRPRLTLYLAVARDDVLSLNKLERAFRSPYYPVVLGRSQDLMSYTFVGQVDVQQTDRAFYDGTLLELADAPTIGGRTVALTMPRHIDEGRRVSWGQYAALLHDPRPPIVDQRRLMQFEGRDAWQFWVDPSPDAAHPYEPGVQRGLVWHRWSA